GYDVGRLEGGTSGFSRSLYLSGQIRPRVVLAACLARLGKDEEAWEQAEADHSRGLLDDLPAEKGAGESPRPLLARRQEVSAGLLPLLLSTWLTVERGRRRDALLAERRRLQVALARLTARQAERLASRAAVQRSLPADAALVMWLAGGPEVWACVLRRTGP